MGGGRRGIFDGIVTGSLKLREEVKNKRRMGKKNFFVISHKACRFN